MYKIVILTGVPRSGSTLSCHLLNHYQNTLALLEPMSNQPDAQQGKFNACVEIARFAFQCRKDVLQNSEVISRHQHGQIPANPLEDKPAEALRKAVVRTGNVKLERNFDQDFSLIIKQNAFFTSLLDELVNYFPCYGVIRNPLAVLASWCTVDLPVNRGHIPAGERFDPELHDRLKRTPDTLDRQIIILNWFFQRFDQNLTQEHILKYEDVIALNGANFSKLSYNGKLEKQIGALDNKNANPLYKNIEIDKLRDKLLDKSDGVFWKYYTETGVSSVYQHMKQKYNQN